MASISLGAEPRRLERADAGSVRQPGAGLSFADPAALLDAGAGPDPLVAGVHEMGEVVVGDDAVGHGEAGAEESRTGHVRDPGWGGSSWDAAAVPSDSASSGATRVSSLAAVGMTIPAGAPAVNHATAGDRPEQPDPAQPGQRQRASPCPRHVSHITPTGVSHRGHAVSARRWCRSTIRDEPNPRRSPWSRPVQTAGPAAPPGRRMRFQTMLVAPQPWLSLTPTTKRFVRRASATTESRCARRELVRLGRGVRRSRIRRRPRPPACRVDPSGSRRTRAATARRARRRRSRCSRSSARSASSEPLYRPPVHRAESPSRTTCAFQALTSMPGQSAGGPVCGPRPATVLWSVTNTASNPARRCHRRFASVSKPRIRVPRTSCETLVWLWTSNTTSPVGVRPARPSGGARAGPRSTKSANPPARPARRRSSRQRGPARRRVAPGDPPPEHPAAAPEAVQHGSPMRNPRSRLMLSIETPSHRLNSGANTTYSRGTPDAAKAGARRRAGR